MDGKARRVWRRPAVWAAAALLLSAAGSGAWAFGLFPGPGSCSGGPVAKDAPAGPASVLAGLTGAERYDRPLIVTTEQAVVAYNDTHRPNPAVSLMPDEGTLMLDHPYVVTTKDQRRRAAAEAFQAALGTRSTRNILQQAGFRAPNGTFATAYADEHDLPEEAPRSLRLPTREEIEQARTTWT